MKNQNTQSQLVKFFNIENNQNTSNTTLEDNVSHFKSKTPKQKLTYSIDKEIEILKDRDNLELIQLSKKGEIYTNKSGETSTYKNDRYENRFWKNSSNGNVLFNLKYKGKIIPIIEGKSLSCKNDRNVLIDSLTQIKTQINLLDDSDILFDSLRNNQ